jgi:hypothetical protein
MGRKQFEIALSWAAVISLFLATEYAIFRVSLFWTIMGFWALCIAVLPAVIRRDTSNILPFELLFLIAVPFYLYFIPQTLGWSDRFYYDSLLRASEVIATFFIGFVTMMDLHAYTSLRMNKVFAIAFTVLLTMALSNFFAIGNFLSDQLFGTSVVSSNRELMMNLIYSFFGGIVMGILLTLYIRHMPLERLRRYSIGRIGDER